MSSQRRVATIGDQELALLHFVGQQGRATVAQAVQGFGVPRGLARSTVLTMMERLRRKGHLTRRPIEGVYHYMPRTAPAAAVRQAVEGFISRTLGGSVAPFVSYLAEQEHLSDDEIAELEALVRRMKTGRKKKERD